MKGVKRPAEYVESHRLKVLAWHRKAQEERAAARGVTVPELLILEKKERNARSYANLKARQQAEREAA
jgi:hypothetical protein